MKAADVMTREVLKVFPDTPIQEIAKIIHEHRISGVPVVTKGDEIVGIVTEGDLIIKLARPHMPPHIEILGGIFYLRRPQDMDEELKKITAVLARDIMTEKVITVTEECEIEDIASIMVSKKINHIPVVREGKLVGIVSRGDLIDTMVEKHKDDNEIPDAP
ncbi:MAG: CBS domain-containing protein [Candidatus Eremiobacteraeota bacterium]|nr:CBS domain-containing protein [Candidatus Eremiobacteraeota bacterium]